jgi:hypothetical protein
VNADALEELRELLMQKPQLRAQSEAVVEEMLAGIADLEDDEPAGDWLTELGCERLPIFEITIGELRERLRGTLAELAARDA